MFRIGTFSKFTCITIKALRYYDKIGLLVPNHIDPETHYRYYTADQMIISNQITALKNLGFSLEEIDAVVCNGESITERLQQKHREFSLALHKQQQQLRMLENLLKINQEETMNTMNVTLKQLPEQAALTLRRVIEHYEAQGELWASLNSYIKTNDAQFAGPCFTVDYNEGYKEHDVDLMVCQVIDRVLPDQGDIQFMTLPGGEFASLIYKGPYEGLHQAYQSILRWIEEQDLIIAGPDREIYHENMGTTENPEEFVTELLIPVREK